MLTRVVDLIRMRLLKCCSSGLAEIAIAVAKIGSYPKYNLWPNMAGRQDPVVLSFHDSCLRQSDMNLLSGTHWLNDKLIGFAFE